MTVGRIKSFPYPERIDSIESIDEYLKNLYRSLTEEQVEKLTDFEDMDVDSLQISDLTISTSIKPTADATVDLGAVGATDYRFGHLYLSGNLSDETNTLTVANAKSAYTHSQIAGGNSVHVSTTENTQWDGAYTHSQIAGGNSVHVSTTENTNWDSAHSHISATGASHSYINQDVTSTSTTAAFAKLQVSGATDSGLNLTHANSYLYFSGSTGSKGIAYKDTGNALRAAMRFPSGSNVVTLINHAANGTVEIHANTATTDLAGDVTVATFEDDNVTIATTMSVAGTLTIPTALTGVIRADSGVLSVEGTAVLDADFGSAGLCATNGSGTYSIVTDNSATWDNAQAGDTALTNLSTVATTANRYLRITGADTFDERTYANVLSDIGGAGSGANSDITSMTGITGTIATPTNLSTKTTAAWSKSIGSGGDYNDWATMITAMPDLIAHAVTVTLEIGTTLTEDCELKNKHGVTSAGVITIQAERYFPTVGILPTADGSGTGADTMQDASAFQVNDYYNSCWILIVDGTGTDNGFVQITDTVAADGEIFVAAWPGTQPDATSRYVIVGALIDGGGTRGYPLFVGNNTATIYLRGIGIKDSIYNGLTILSSSYVDLGWCGFNINDTAGIYAYNTSRVYGLSCGFVGNNTDNAAYSGGVLVSDGSNFIYFAYTAFSDNLRRGILVERNSCVRAVDCFGDGNGTWGIYCQDSGQAKISGTECSGSSGNHDDVGTAGDNNADQSAAYT